MKTTLTLIFTIATLALRAADGPIPNQLIDYATYLKIANEVRPVREQRRLTEEQFIARAREKGALVLDARSADKFKLRHIQGAISLPFTDFTEAALARAIPAKDTPVLIYCNNNFLGAQRSFASKAPSASLNISTFVALATYGYTNVYELGPLLDIQNTQLVFAGEEVSPQK